MTRIPARSFRFSKSHLLRKRIIEVLARSLEEQIFFQRRKESSRRLTLVSSESLSSKHEIAIVCQIDVDTFEYLEHKRATLGYVRKKDLQKKDRLTENDCIDPFEEGYPCMALKRAV